MAVNVLYSEERFVYSFYFGRQYWYTTPGKENEATEYHASGGESGDGASNYTNGDNVGTSSAKAGKAGTLGSGGGGYRGDDTAGGKGGLPYIFFCSNMEFSIEKK